MKWAGHVATMEEGRSGFKILTFAPVGKIPLGRPINTRNLVDSIQDRAYWRALRKRHGTSRFRRL